MKKSRSLAMVMALALLVTLLAPLSAQAAAYTVKELQPKTWAQRNPSTLYKITTSAKGTLVFTFKGGSGSAEFINNGNYDSLYSDRKVTVDKGTYYVRVRFGSLKYTFTKDATAQKKRIPPKATALDADTTTYINEEEQDDFSKWFKISVEDDGKVNIWNSSNSLVVLYDKDMNKVSLSSIVGPATTQNTTSKAVDAGTYYIRISGYRYMYYHGNAGAVTLRWE